MREVHRRALCRAHNSLAATEGRLREARSDSPNPPPCFDPAAYRKRNQVERGFNRRKHWRGLATRYDKRIDSYQATLDLAEALDWLRAVPDGTP